MFNKWFLIHAIWLAAIATTLAMLPVDQAAAHPLDQLTQHLFVELNSTEIQLTTAIGGGLLANELVLSGLDLNRDQTISPVEQQTWLESWLRTLAVSIDGTTFPVSLHDVTISVPPVEEFHLGYSPILLTYSIALPASGPKSDHLIAIHNSYLINRTTYRLDIRSNAGTEVIDQSWPDSSIRIAFSADPSVVSTENETATKAAEAWSGNKVIKKARELLDHERTPAFVFTMLGIFALMGALHAMQPGHGKTLVAAYLVATGGTPGDALMLAGIVTFTHTISVYILGLATLAASELFLPSKVIPVMGVISGLLVALMGLSMLRSALRRKRQSHGAESATRDHPHGVDGEGQTHTHDHATLSEEEHTRLHVEEALAVRNSVSRRNLITLGVSGGMAPCPDALAILLLSIGMNQAGLGMIAIVAFSLGLAAVLVAFGLMVALMGPAWNRAKSGASGRSSWFSTGITRFMMAAPMVSACVVFLLGVGMAWRSINVG